MPRPGRVTEVCKEWLVLEDGALAYRLQNEEIEHHYMGNRFRNALVRQDIPCAKDEQRREEEEAANVQALYDQMIKEQEEMDAKIAQQLSEKIEHEEKEKKMAHEQEDKEFARQFQERERQKVERRQEKKTQHASSRAEHVGNVQVASGQDSTLYAPSPEATACYSNGSDAQAQSYEHILIQELRRSTLSEEGNASSLRALEHNAMHAPSSSVDPLSDLSDFCLQPDPNMSQEEARLFQEEQDAELARLLQEQEMKRRGDSVLDRDRVMAVEAQDHELARMLQEKEKAKIKRARERARQRALLKKQQLQLQTRESVSAAAQSGDGVDVDESSSGSPPPLPSPGEWPDHSSCPSEQEKKILMKGTGKPKCPDPPGTLMNIAMAIDPTYPQRCHTNTQQLQTQASAAPLLVPATTSSTPEFDEEDLNAIPPYMPIQGQRRCASLEKKTKKSKGKKESKDSCKQQ